MAARKPGVLMSVRFAKQVREKTVAAVAYQEIGVLIGRACVADPVFRRWVMLGFTRAIHEDIAGRKPDDPALARNALGAVAHVVTEALGLEVTQPAPRKQRRRRA